jgi:two-component system sensor histidine kinase BaeS
MAARLEADETQRRTLLADVGHELRTPLAVLQGNVEAILDGVHEPDAAHLNAILEETRVLSRLVEDLRTLTLSEAGTLALHPEPTDLAVLVGEVVGSFEAAAAVGGVAVTGKVDEDVPLLEVDPVRVREVLVNLVANALRHTPAGGTVDVLAGLDGGSVAVVVRDTGVGIEPGLLSQVFDRFAKAPESRGSGLGLAIASGLVEAHGGTITVTSALGEGSTFRFTLPLDRDARDPNPA